MMTSQRRRELESVVSRAFELGVDVTAESAELMLDHLDLVLCANERLNLTSITSREAAVSRHIVDSVAASAHIEHVSTPIADLGSGAGYPGIPVSIAVGEPVELVESIKKKATFLEQCVTDLGGLNGSVVFSLRAEELALQSPGRYGTVLARAVTSLPSLVELASPLLRMSGRLVAMKGSPTAKERESGSAAGRMVGMKECDWVEYALPGSGERRTIVIYQKTAPSDVALPRRVGLAQRGPLA